MKVDLDDNYVDALLREFVTMLSDRIEREAPVERVFAAQLDLLRDRLPAGTGCPAILPNAG